MAKGVKNKKIEATEAQVVLDNVKDMELTKVVSEIGNLQVSLQGTLAHLTATITNKIQQVEQLDTAIGLKEQRLQELHGIEKEAVSLDEMKAQKEEEARKWEKERDERNAQWDEEEEERAKIWQRTEEDFKYTTEQAHKKVQDDFESQLSKRNREELLRAEQLQRSWTERENGLKAKEQEFTDLKAQVVGFDQRLKSEVAKAEAVLGNVLKKQYEHEAALLRKDAESEKNLSAAKISAMSDQMENLEKQIHDLQVQLAAARSDAKEVATQALQSASGRQVADALQSVVNTRNDNVPSKTK
jgi:chromosome segregation ATPase